MKPSAPLNLSSLGPSRNLKELLADPVHYVAARHNSEPILPVGLVPINQSSQQPRSSPLDSALTPSISKQDNRDQPAASSSTSHKSNELSSNWPSGIQGAAHGLINNGNTCYLNATLQALVHTPPVVSTLPKLHSSRSCSNNQNCTLCRLVGLIQGAFHGHARAIVPHAILGRLKSARLHSNAKLHSFTDFLCSLIEIAPHFRRYEQEDAHEFLRLLLDSCVESEVSAKQLRVTPSLKDTTAVHRLFGGRFCSRVHCTKCKHNSDTYDSFLDVSLPLSHNTRDLHDSLNLFIKPDHLTGNNRYKCEKCKSLVNATKSLSINRAPFVLTVHLKRFSPLRKKITASIDYPETLDIGPWMTDGGQVSCPQSRV